MGNPGDQIFIGTPDDTMGTDGDVFIDTGPKKIYKKLSGAYGTGVVYA